MDHLFLFARLITLVTRNAAANSFQACHSSILRVSHFFKRFTEIINVQRMQNKKSCRLDFIIAFKNMGTSFYTYCPPVFTNIDATAFSLGALLAFTFSGTKLAINHSF